MKFTFESTDSVEQFTLPNVNGHSPIHKGPGKEHRDEGRIWLFVSDCLSRDLNL